MEISTIKDFYYNGEKLEWTIDNNSAPCVYINLSGKVGAILKVYYMSDTGYYYATNDSKADTEFRIKYSGEDLFTDIIEDAGKSMPNGVSLDLEGVLYDFKIFEDRVELNTVK